VQKYTLFLEWWTLLKNISQKKMLNVFLFKKKLYLCILKKKKQ